MTSGCWDFLEQSWGVQLQVEGVEHRFEFEGGFIPLFLWVGIGDDTGAGVQPDAAILGDGGTDGDGECAILVGINPADGGGVPAAWNGFGLVDEVESEFAGGAAEGGCGVELFQDGEDAGCVGQTAVNGCVQVLNVA